MYTHNLQFSAAAGEDLLDALKVFAELGYVRAEDVASIPVLGTKPVYVVYSPLGASNPLPADVVLLFVNARQTLLLSEATQQVEGQNPLAMGRPACAVIPQVMNSWASGAEPWDVAGRELIVMCSRMMWRCLLFLEKKLRPTLGALRHSLRRMMSCQNLHEIRRRDIEAGGVSVGEGSRSPLWRAKRHF